MIDSILLEGLVSGGPSTVLAFAIFLMYRKDKKSSECNWRDMVKRDIDTREKSTEAITELTVALRTMNGRK